MNRLIIILAILIICFELYRLLRGYWIQRILEEKREARQLRKPRVMKPKSERDCPFCVKEKGRGGSFKAEMPVPWGLRKGHGGPKKKYPPKDISARIKNANITASPMRISMPWSAIAITESKSWSRISFARPAERNSRFAGIQSSTGSRPNPV